MYNKAVCNMHLGVHKFALPDLLNVANNNPYYDQQLYIAIAMCYVAITDYVMAIKYVSKGLSKFPKFYEGYVTRGQLYN